VFRVIRVIKQLKSLRRIVKALLSSVIPVSYSLLLLLLATAIFAVVAVDTLGESNPELFGSFSVSFFTMWQVGTGDGWSDVAREFRRESDGMLNPLVALFFAAYVFVVGLVLINIGTHSQKYSLSLSLECRCIVHTDCTRALTFENMPQAAYILKSALHSGFT